MEFGRLESVGTCWRMIFVRHLEQPPARVWRALTEPDDLAAWFPATVQGARAAGATLHFVFPGGEAPASTGEVLAIDPPHLLELRWDADILRFELRADDVGTELRFLHTFDEVGRAARDGGGWHACLDNLDAHLAGRRPDPQAWERYEWEYVAALGPEASAIRPPEAASRSSGTDPQVEEARRA